MLRVIGGKRCDTEKAELACELTCEFAPDDFRWHHTSLYRTAAGAWFLAGRGHAYSMWGTTKAGGASPGEGIRIIEADEALSLLEAEAEDGLPAIAAHFRIEDA